MNSEHNTWILDGIVDKNQASIDTSTKVLKEEKFQKAAVPHLTLNFFSPLINNNLIFKTRYLLTSTCLKLKLVMVSSISRKKWFLFF